VLYRAPIWATLVASNTPSDAPTRSGTISTLARDRTPPSHPPRGTAKVATNWRPMAKTHVSERCTKGSCGRYRARYALARGSRSTATWPANTAAHAAATHPLLRRSIPAAGSAASNAIAGRAGAAYFG
jgi:hypothetical protein